MESLETYIQALDHLYEEGLIDTKPNLSTLKVGETVFHAEEPADKIFGVKAGKIQLMRYLESGQVGTQYSVAEGEWFGERALFYDVYSNSAIATQPSEIIAIPTEIFQTLLHHNSDVSLSFINQLTEQLHTAKHLMTIRCIRSANDRVLAYLDNLRAPGQNTCIMRCPIKAIAEQICLTPEVVSRSLRKLQDDGIIQRNRRKITFLRQYG